MTHLGSLLIAGLASLASNSSVDASDECRRGDARCLERQHEKFCTERTATIETCKAWISWLERHSSDGSPELLLKVGQAYEALAHMASSTDEANAHRDRAIKIYREMIQRDRSNSQAILALAVATKDRKERIRLLKRGIALAPNEIYAMQLLASELQQSGKAEETLEAAKLIERAYLRQTGRNRGYLASTAYELYLNADAPKEAAKLQRQVLEDIGAKDLKPLPTDPNLDQVSRALMSSCDHFFVPVIGSQKCMGNLEIVVKHLTSRADSARLKELAAVAASAMLEVSEAESELASEYPEWRQTLRAWLKTLLEKDYEVPSVFNALARVTSGDERLGALRRAAALEPSNGQSALRLGAEYAQRGMWNEAVQELTRAKQLLPSELKRAVDYDLAIARERLAQEKSARPK